MRSLFMATVAAAAMAPLVAGAQTQTQATRSQGQAQNQPVVQQCLTDLQAFRQQMREDGLWLSGYRSGYGWPSGMASTRGMQAARTPGGADMMTGADTRRTGTLPQGGGAPGVPPGNAPGVVSQPDAGPSDAGPWGSMQWRMPPMQELRILHAAAAVMAQRGEAQGCRTTLAELREAYGQYGDQLRQAGYDSNRIGSYRQMQIANARPVAEMGGVLRADNITGTDVRSPRDEYLGSIEDVILDPESGRIGYAVVAHGGFLGIGEDYVAVPWQRLRAAPNMEIFVLDATEQRVEGAPTVDPDIFVNAQRYGQRRQEIDRYWQQGG